MNKLKKLPLALALAVLGTTSSLSALAMKADQEPVVKEIKIEIEKDNAKGASIFVVADGESTAVDISPDTLNDKEALAEALSELPDETKDKVLQALDGLSLDAKHIKVHSGDHKVLEWNGSMENEHVIVMDIDGELGDDSDKEKLHQVIKRVIKGHGSDGFAYKFKHGGKLSADSLIRLLEHGKFSQDDLDKIQQALDAKR